MTLPEKIKHYGLTQKDWFQHKHYTILTRMGIDKIQAIEKINISYEAVQVQADFCVVKAIGVKDKLRIETFGSAKYGSKNWITFDKPTAQGKTGRWEETGNTSTWYVMEMAEKRAMSRAVLKITGFYELGVFGEDESEDFTKQPATQPQTTTPPATTQTTSKLPKLVKGSESWDKMYDLISDKRLTKIEQVTTKYTITETLKKEIEVLITEGSK